MPELASAASSTTTPVDHIDRPLRGPDPPSSGAASSFAPTADRRPSAATAATDLLVAFAAGPACWITSRRRLSSAEQATIGVCFFGLVAMISATAALGVTSENGSGVFRAKVVALSVAAVIVLGISLVMTAIGRSSGGRAWVAIAWRAVTAVLLAAAWASFSHPVAIVLAWPVAVFAGAETALTAHFIGQPQAGLHLWRRFLTSPIHIGVLTGLGLVMALGRSSDARVIAGWVIAGMELLAMFGASMHGLVSGWFAREQAEHRAVVSEAIEREHRHRAHWIHDDVCAGLRGLRVKLASSPMTSMEVDAELGELDHQLRLRQLDEVIGGGSVSAAEVIQPFVRRAQNHGVRITEVPRMEDAAIELPSEPARLLRRAVAVLVENLMVAGASTMAIQLTCDDAWLELVVMDDAGGFDLADVPAGRGLDSLRVLLTPSRLRVERHGNGSRITARILLEDLR